MFLQNTKGAALPGTACSIRFRARLAAGELVFLRGWLISRAAGEDDRDPTQRETQGDRRFTRFDAFCFSLVDTSRRRWSGASLAFGGRTSDHTARSLLGPTGAERRSRTERRKAQTNVLGGSVLAS